MSTAAYLWKRVMFVFAAASLLSLPLAPLVRRAAADEPKKAEVKKSELHSSMEDVDDAMKKLRRTIRKPDQNAESLKLVSEIQTLMVAGKAMVPTKTEKLPEADRAKFVAEYRKEMAGVIIQLCNLETALLDGDNAKAQEIYKAITEREDKDHDQFMQKEEKK